MRHCSRLILTLGWLPLVVVTSSLWLSWPLSLLIIHMLPEIVQLCLIKLRRQLQVPRIFQILQRSTDRRNHRIGFRPLEHNPFQPVKPSLQLRNNLFFVEQIVVLARDFGSLVNLLEQIGNMITSNDAACAPDLNHVAPVDEPLVLSVLDVDDVDALHV